MKSAGTLIIAATLLLSAVARAQDVATSESPYASIVSRNMFGLLPIPPPDTNPPAPPIDPPPKITPNGIMTIFGRLQALFKVASRGKPGQPAKDDSFVLAEGERQAGIEVLKINQPDGIITFNNHGTIEELPLVAAKDTTSAGPGGPRGPGAGLNPGMKPSGGMTPAERAAMRRPPGNSPSPVMPNNGNNGNNAGNPNSNSAGNGNVNDRGIYQPGAEANPMLPEERAILLEAQRAKYQDEGNPAASLMPPPSRDMQRVMDGINNGTQ